MEIIVTILFIVIYLAIATYFAFKVANAPIFLAKQKKINILLVYIVPIIWWVLIYYMIKPEPKYDPELKRKPSEHYYESNKQIHGAGGAGFGNFGN